MKTLLTYLFLLSSLVSLSQEDSSFTLVRRIQGDIADVAMDNLENLYVLSSGGQIKKYNAQGDSMALYNQVRNYGQLHSIDVSNPLKPILFYKDFGTIVILDRFLAQRSSIDLRKLNMLQPTAAGLSYDNNLWVFDEYDHKLRKIDESGNTLLETADFRTLFEGRFSPQRILNDNGLLYLADSLQGIRVFDNYGAYKRAIAIKGWEGLALKGSFLIQTKPGKITVYNMNTFLDQSKAFPSTFQPYLRSFPTTNALILFDKSTVQVYRVKF